MRTASSPCESKCAAAAGIDVGILYHSSSKLCRRVMSSFVFAADSLAHLRQRLPLSSCYSMCHHDLSQEEEMFVLLRVR